MYRGLDEREFTTVKRSTYESDCYLKHDSFTCEMWLFGSVLTIKFYQSHFDKYLHIFRNIFQIATG